MSPSPKAESQIYIFTHRVISKKKVLSTFLWLGVSHRRTSTWSGVTLCIEAGGGLHTPGALGDGFCVGSEEIIWVSGGRGALRSSSDMRITVGDR